MRPLLLLLLLTLPVRADLLLDYQLTVGVQPEEGSPEQFTQTMQVVLKDRLLNVSTDAGWTNRYNFEDRRLQRSEHGILSEQSLYSVVAFRAFETANRLHLGRALAAAQVETTMEPVLLEHLFSVRSEEPTTLETRVKPEGGLLCTHEGKTLFESSAEGVPLAPEEAEQFRRFLRHQVGGHPDILEKLDIVPNRLTVRLYDVGRTRTMNLVLKEHSKEPVDLPKLEGGPPSGRLQKLVAAAEDSHVAESLAGLEQRALALLEAGSPLPAALRFLEMGLTTGGALPQAFQERRAELLENPDMARLTSALEVENQEQAQASLKTLAELEPAAGEAVHVVRVLQANLMGPGPEAQERFLAALETNPTLVGVWKDLGFTYLRQYEMADAWRCWDTARSLVPGSPMMDEVDELEQELFARHPEFF